MKLPRSETWKFNNPEEYSVFVAWPDEAQKADPESELSVIYVLDGNAFFATVVEALRLRLHRPSHLGIRPALVVGIGYPIDRPYDRDRRTFDFTFGPSVEDSLATGVGGASKFTTFLDQVIKPAVNARFNVDPLSQTIVGHSLAGFYVLSLLLEQPHLFQNYVSISPSIWWDSMRLKKHVDSAGERLAAVDDKASRRAIITVGEYEQTLSPSEKDHIQAQTIAERRERRKMVDNARDLSESLKKVSPALLAVDFSEFRGQDHASTIGASINQYLPSLLKRVG